MMLSNGVSRFRVAAVAILRGKSPSTSATAYSQASVFDHEVEVYKRYAEKHGVDMDDVYCIPTFKKAS